MQLHFFSTSEIGTNGNICFASPPKPQFFEVKVPADSSSTEAPEVTCDSCASAPSRREPTTRRKTMGDDKWKNVFRDFSCNCFAMQRICKQHLRRELQPHQCRLRLSRLSTSLVSTNHAETEMYLLLPAIISISHLQSAYQALLANSKLLQF